MTDVKPIVAENDATSGHAALSLLEAIILTLRAKGVLTDDEVDDAFGAAIAAHIHRYESLSDAENAKVVGLLTRLRVEGNAVRLDE